jgi:hypothetical protein
MAITFTASMSQDNYLYPPKIGGSVPVTGNLNIGNSYTTGGEDIAATDFDANASTLTDLICPSASLDGSIKFVFDSASAKVLAFNNAGTEVASTTNLSAAGKSCRVIAYVAR